MGKSPITLEIAQQMCLLWYQLADRLDSISIGIMLFCGIINHFPSNIDYNYNMTVIMVFPPHVPTFSYILLQL